MAVLQRESPASRQREDVKFLPATGLLTNAYRPAEKARAQAANEFLLFSVVALIALGAGPLLSALGWAQLNAWLIPFALLPLWWCRSGARVLARG